MSYRIVFISEEANSNDSVESLNYYFSGSKLDFSAVSVLVVETILCSYGINASTLFNREHCKIDSMTFDRVLPEQW